MPVISTSIHISNPLGLAGFVVLWIILFECAHVLVTLLRNGPLIFNALHLAKCPVPRFRF